MIPIAPEGYPYVLALAVAGVLSWTFGYRPLAAVLGLAALACLAFFRDPARSCDAPENAVVAPADGKVLSVGAAPAALAGLGLSQQISIFMSPANVHVNRAPIAGLVREASLTPGKKLPAFRDKASELNEHSFVHIEGELGAIAYKQIAGSLARRVVCDLSAGDRVERGQRVGLIKFGSRVDLFLPATARIRVRPGERTRAGITVVADLPAGSEQ
ncbi:MAG: phosphatidylserine decarboxylase [Acidobacteriota bacterium]